MSNSASAAGVATELDTSMLRLRVDEKLCGQQLVQACLKATRELADETSDRSVLLFFAMLTIGRHPKGTSAVQDFSALFAELGLNECSQCVRDADYCASDLAFFWSAQCDFSRLFEKSNLTPVKTFKTHQHPIEVPKPIMYAEWGESPFHEFDVFSDTLQPKHWNLYDVSDATIIYSMTEFAVLDQSGRPIIELCSGKYQHVFFTECFGKHLNQLMSVDQSHNRSGLSAESALMIQDMVPTPNYCHWLLDQLPRTRHLEPSQHLIMHQLAPFMQSTLDMMNIATERVIELKKHPIVAVKRLLVDTSMARHWHHPCQEVNTELVDYVKSSLSAYEANLVDRREKRNIYVSRNRSSRRHISNETELLECLKRFNFEVVYLEELSIAEQISVFKNASVIVAPHGAGLSNVIFCENASVIEIFNPNYGTAGFRLLAQLVGSEYQHIMGKNKALSASERQSVGRAKLQREDIEVDTALLVQCLEKILASVR